MFQMRRYTTMRVMQTGTRNQTGAKEHSENDQLSVKPLRAERKEGDEGECQRIIKPA